MGIFYKLKLPSKTMCPYRAGGVWGSLSKRNGALLFELANIGQPSAMRPASDVKAHDMSFLDNLTCLWS